MFLDCFAFCCRPFSALAESKKTSVLSCLQNTSVTFNSETPSPIGQHPWPLFLFTMASQKGFQHIQVYNNKPVNITDLSPLPQYLQFICVRMFKGTYCAILQHLVWPVLHFCLLSLFAFHLVFLFAFFPPREVTPSSAVCILWWVDSFHGYLAHRRINARACWAIAPRRSVIPGEGYPLAFPFISVAAAQLVEELQEVLASNLPFLLLALYVTALNNTKMCLRV